MSARALWLLPALLLACSGGGPTPTAPTPPPPAAAPSPAAATAPVPADSPPVPADSSPVPADSPPPTAATAPLAAIELTFVGDIIFGRYRGDNTFDAIPGPDDHPFAEIAETMRSDLLIGNLETPLTRDLPQKSPIGAQYRFGASKQMAQHLVDGGFTALSLANNHAFDLRAQGMLDSPAILRELGIIPLGASRTEAPLFRVETIERSNWKVGILAVTARRNAPHFDGTPELPFLSTTDFDALLSPVIAAARSSHDLIIVFVHWGEEYADDPAPHQRRAAKALLDHGADLVVGHHPHVLQGIERHGRGAVAYSLGNFLFENTHDIPRLTGVLRARFTAERCLETLTFHPAYIKRIPSKHPVPATRGLGKQVRERMTTLSASLDTSFELRGEDLTLSSFPCTPATAPAPPAPTPAAP
ncbi:CapA family protein [Nannocystis sp.]|uniref:CapA family protein n=1 Tax=Nannocystis sp. TaxID=1962667 RepID=UPI0025EFF64F|nr:CapA family protein [Nannocystis sp.]MBK7825363.1 CapA family protein [Nannocystis sp.]